MKIFFEQLKRKALFSGKIMPLFNRERLPVERPPIPISFSELSDFYFPDGSNFQAVKIREKFQFLGRVLQQIANSEIPPLNPSFGPDKPKFWMSMSSLMPFISNQLPHRDLSDFESETGFFNLDAKSSQFSVLMRLLIGPEFNLTVSSELNEIYKLVIATFEKADDIKNLNPQSFGLTKETQIFKLTGQDDQILVKRIKEGNEMAKKSLYWIIEKNETMTKQQFLTIRLAINTKSDNKKVQEYSPFRDLFRFNIRPSTFTDVENVISWNEDKAQMTFDNEPTFKVSGNYPEKLKEPINITPFGFSRILDEAVKIYQRFPDATKTFPLGQQEFATSLGYFNLIKVTTRLIQQSVSETSDMQNESAINQNTIEFIKKEFDKLGDKGRQFVINTLIWMGFDIWQDIADISYQLKEAEFHNNNRFWHNFRTLGLNNLFPSANPHNVNTFNLFPELDSYVDHRPGKEFKQSNEYFMNICLSLAWYAETIGEEPFGCVIVKDGKIVGAAYNEINKYHGDQTRHAEIIAIERARSVLKDQTLKGCKLYTTASPCGQCSYNIRKAINIKEVYIGVESAMASEELINPILTAMGRNDFGPPPSIEILKIDDLQYKFFQLYIKKMGWKKQFSSLLAQVRSEESEKAGETIVGSMPR